jgi:hypothetical protein
MQGHGKPVQVADMERAKVVVEGIVQQRVIDSEVDNLL